MVMLLSTADIHVKIQRIVLIFLRKPALKPLRTYNKTGISFLFLTTSSLPDLYKEVLFFSVLAGRENLYLPF